MATSMSSNGQARVNGQLDKINGFGLWDDQPEVQGGANGFPPLRPDDPQGEHVSGSNGSAAPHYRSAHPRPEQVKKQYSQDTIHEIDFAVLGDGSLVELVEDPGDSWRCLLAVSQDGRVRYVDSLEEDGCLLVPCQRSENALAHIRLPTVSKPYGSVTELTKRLENFIQTHVGVPDFALPALTHFVLSTWIIDRLPLAPYLLIVGLPESGKTSLLKLLSMLCRRSVLVSDFTTASVYETSAKFMPTFLLDDIDCSRNQREVRRLLRSGTDPCIITMRRSRFLHAFGAKVFTCAEPPDDPALISRCIQVPMTENRKFSMLTLHDHTLEQQVAELQAQLLQFRFDHYERLAIAPRAAEEDLRPRSQDLLRCLAAPIEDALEGFRLLEFFRSHEHLTSEALCPEDNAVLSVLWHLIQGAKEEAPMVVVNHLAGLVNRKLKQAGESFRVKPRRVGAILTKFGIGARQRGSSGYRLLLRAGECQRIRELVDRFGLDDIVTQAHGEFFRIHGDPI